MINITINNQEFIVQEGLTIIQVADLFKIPIPRFCYHDKLSVAANCRMCLVEVVNEKKLLPACSTYVSVGMVIFTKSEKTIAGQKAAMEFLLINHPLECPICEKAGECELQDLSIQYGNDNSVFKEKKRVISDQNLGPLIATNMTRCIHCTRCVRFGKEIAGIKELGVIYRGENMQISTFVEQTINSEVSGNMIDLCPVGALTSKPYQFSARSWELQQKPSISCHDCIGSNINYHISNDQIKRAVPRNNPLINDIWLSDRDRFSYTGINAKDRLKHPLIKQNGNWKLVSWAEVEVFIVDKLLNIIANHGANQIGGLISPSATLEECYLFQKLFRTLGSNNIDHRLRQVDFRDQELAPLYPNLGLESVSELKHQRFVLLIGSYINKEQPIVGITLRAAVQAGCLVAVINPIDFEFNFVVHYKNITPYADLLTPLLKITKAVIELSKDLSVKIKWLNKLLENITYNKIDLDIANQLLSTKPTTKISIILGQLAINHPDYSKIVAVSNLICLLVGAKFGCFSDGANSAGAWLAGCIPHRTSSLSVTFGKNAFEMLSQPLKAYILLGIEPELDSVQGYVAAKTLQQAELVVAISSFESDLLLQYAEVLLPMAVMHEGMGTYINIVGSWQNFSKVKNAPGISKTAVEILLSLGQSLKLPGFVDFNNEDLLNIGQTIKQMHKEANSIYNTSWQLRELDLNVESSFKTNHFISIALLSLYAIDPITRRAECLQQTNDAKLALVAINSKTAILLGINHNEVIKITIINNIDAKLSKNFKLPVVIDDRVAEGCLLFNQNNISNFIIGNYNNILLEKLILENSHA